MKITSKLLLGILLSISISSCYSYKKVAYFQDIDQIKDLKNYTNYELKIKKNDLLNIFVSAPDIELVTPYNQGVNNNNIPYLVDINGYINFPLLGKLRVEGLTLQELSDNLTAAISKDVKNAIINVSLKNSKITVLGEVGSPGTYDLNVERTTILEALSMAGDLTLGAKRSNVLLIRENDGKFEQVRIDLRKSDILSSPYYYLCQNDVIYVTPTSTRTFTGSNSSIFISIVTATLSVVMSIIALTK